MGIEVLRKIQLGKETTPGTAVAATTIWRGRGVIRDARRREFPEEQIGYTLPVGRSYEAERRAEVELEETPATYEQLPYLLAACLEGVVTGTQDGTGSDYIYQYDVPTAAANTIQTFTVEGGDDQRVDEVEYAFVDEMKLSWESGEAVQMAATLIGRQATDTEFTNSLSIPTVEEIIVPKLYIDASSGTFGTTQKTATLVGFELTIPSGYEPVWTGDGQVYFTTIAYCGHQKQRIEGTLTLLHNSNAETEIAAARNGDIRLLRLLCEGSAVATPGTTYSKKTLRIDLAIQYDKVPELDAEDGLDTVELPFHAVYLKDDDFAGQIIVVNELESLP